MWYGVDPLAEKYVLSGSYVYCVGNPIKLIDTDGKKILFVNGHWRSGWIGEKLGSNYPCEKYWGDSFTFMAHWFFRDYSQINESNYIDGSSQWGGDMSGSDRYNAGYEYARANIKGLTSGMKDGEAFNMVTHSEGSAYGAGVAQYLIDQGFKVNCILHLSSDEGDEFSTPIEPYTLQLSYQGDWLTGNKPIKNADKIGIIQKGDLGLDEVHGITKNRRVFRAANDLKTVQTQENIGSKNGRVSTWLTQRKGTTRFGTKFHSINGKVLKNENKDKK